VATPIAAASRPRAAAPTIAATCPDPTMDATRGCVHTAASRRGAPANARQVSATANPTSAMAISATAQGSAE